MRKFRVLTTVLLLAILAAGCSKSDSENMEGNKEAEKIALEKRLKSEIKQHIVGTWVCDGECDVSWSSTAVAEEKIVVDDIPVSNRTFCPHTFTFSADGNVELYIPKENLIKSDDYPDGRTFKGSYTIKSFVLTPYPFELPPFGIIINYDFTEFNTSEFLVRGGYVYVYNFLYSDRVLFSSDYSVMYAFSEMPTGFILRYKRQA